MSKHHLVVGMSGVIGSALFSRLQASASASNITVWGSTYQSDAEAAPRVVHLNLADDPSAWHLPDIPFEVVYLCAGVCRMALCEKDPQGTRHVNVTGMRALAQKLASTGAFMVYLSTNQVFSGECPFVSTTALAQPANEYGRQKAEMEAYLQANCPSSAIVRFTKVVEPQMALIRDWINRLVLHQPVTAFDDMMLAPVTLQQALEVLVAVGLKKQSGIYHVSGAADVSYYQVATYLAQQLKRPLSLIQAEKALAKGIKKSFLPRFTTLDCSSTISMSGQKPMPFSAVLASSFDDLPNPNSPSASLLEEGVGGRRALKGHG